MIEFGLAVMPEPAFAAASLPIFEEGLVDVIEWSFDIGWGTHGIPSWLQSLLDDYAEGNNLLGHGVSFSLLAGQPTSYQVHWLDRLRQETQTRTYRHISEHMGFIGAGRFSFAAPLPVPFHAKALYIGIQRLEQIGNACGLNVGVENLATSLGPRDASAQGAFLTALLDRPNCGEAADGLDQPDRFLVLDLHNLWAQANNTAFSAAELLASYPLHLVREIHVSGGSWDKRDDRRIRRDTHDGEVPTEVIELLIKIAPQCQGLTTVLYERLGTSLGRSSNEDANYQSDVRHLAHVVSALTREDETPTPHASTAPKHTRIDATADKAGDEIGAQIVNEPLDAYQAALLAALHDQTLGSAATVDAIERAAKRLGEELGPLDKTLVGIAADLTRKWGRLK